MDVQSIGYAEEDIGSVYAAYKEGTDTAKSFYESTP